MAARATRTYALNSTAGNVVRSGQRARTHGTAWTQSPKWWCWMSQTSMRALALHPKSTPTHLCPGTRTDLGSIEETYE
eukprot:m.295364 g.295364  ORF g.295364 m.295364 type:complete len:78 (-) comp20037_c0_seq28:281-514(-)